MIKGVLAVLVAGVVSNVQASTLVCQEYGYTDSAEDFHSIKTQKKVSEFKIEQQSVVLNGVEYKSVDPGWAGLDGLAITYYTDKYNTLVYLYLNDKGKREVGVSALEPDSDAIFHDKAVYKNCSFKGSKQAGSRKVLRTNYNGLQDMQPTYSF